MAAVFPLLVSPMIVAGKEFDLPMELLQSFSFWHWLILGVLLIVLEIFAPGVVFLWIGLAAIVTGIVAWLGPDLAVQWQVIFFAVLSVASVIAGRAWLKSHPTETDHPTLNLRGQQYVGRRFMLSEAISGGFGKVKVDDSIWKVEGEDMPEGSAVTVTDVDGTVLKVERYDKAQE